jgi:hypothetical protein
VHDILFEEHLVFQLRHLFDYLKDTEDEEWLLSVSLQPEKEEENMNLSDPILFYTIFFFNTFGIQ